jgi:hypothetical protein
MACDSEALQREEPDAAFRSRRARFLGEGKRRDLLRAVEINSRPSPAAGRPVSCGKFGAICRSNSAAERLTGSAISVAVSGPIMAVPRIGGAASMLARAVRYMSELARRCLSASAARALLLVGPSIRLPKSGRALVSDPASAEES